MSLVVLCLVNPATVVADDWPQWGGPSRDFQVRDAGLGRWAETAPEIAWSQPLGPGYSSIAVDGEQLITLYRDGEDEVVVALSTDDGRRLWEHRYPAPHLKEMRVGYGEGPESTPLVVDGQVFTIGITSKLFALDAKTGAVQWSKDLWGDLGGTLLVRGYGASAVAYGDWVLVTVGGAEHGVVALRRDDGSIAWSSPPFDNASSSPQLLTVDGREQLVVFVNDQALGFDPENGEALWSHPHPSGGAYNITTPIWEPERQWLFLSSAYGGGSRLLELGYDGDTATVVERWSTNRIKVHFTNGVIVGDHLYVSNGRSGGIMMLCVDLDTGEIVWRERSVGRSNFLVAGNRAIALDEDGRLLQLGLAPDNLRVLGELQLVEGRTWTVPALAGGQLYIRDEETIWALRVPREPLAASGDASSPAASGR